MVVIGEGVQQLKKYGQNGLLWAQGKEALKREYYLFQAKVPPYDKPDPSPILARRIEQIIGREAGNSSDQEQGAGNVGEGEKPDESGN